MIYDVILEINIPGNLVGDPNDSDFEHPDSDSE